jgi:hypothetical protein
MAEALTLNGKVQRFSVCNALECLLVHEAVAKSLLPKIGRALLERSVEIRGCPKTCELLPEAKRANDDDWGREYLDLILAVKVVKSFDGRSASIGTVEPPRRFAREPYQRPALSSRSGRDCVVVNLRSLQRRRRARLNARIASRRPRFTLRPNGSRGSTAEMGGTRRRPSEGS